MSFTGISDSVILWKYEVPRSLISTIERKSWAAETAVTESTQDIGTRSRTPSRDTAAGRDVPHALLGTARSIQESLQ